MPSILTPVWQRLDREPPLFLEDEFSPDLIGVRDRLFGLGLLRQAAPSGFASCLGCNRGFVGRVARIPNRRTGTPTPYVPCPECGAVTITPDSLRRWVIDIPALLTAVFAASRGRGVPTELVLGHVWHLGNATWCGRRREAYFVRCVHDGTRAGVAAVLATHPKAVLFFPTEAAAHKWGATTPNSVVALESVGELGSDGITFDTTVVEGRLVDAGFDAPKPKAVPKHATRAANIASLTEALVEFLRGARPRGCHPADHRHAGVTSPPH
jgi:hypothetical protein